jgi:signal transduction histidine kinase
MSVSRTGKQKMDDLRRMVNRMEADEKRLLGRRTQDSRKSQHATMMTFIVASIVACLILIATAVVAISGIRARERVEAELREQRQRAEAASNAKDQFLAVLSHELRTPQDQFLAVLSHELRTPLTAMLGWMHVLQTRDVDEQTRNKALEVINRNLHVQVQLVEDLLNVSQISAGKLQIRPEMVDSRQVVNRSIETARPSADAKGIDLRIETDTDLPRISADPARLQQIVWNLLSNAIKFTPRGGSIRVEIRRGLDELRIVVTDTGQGISPEFLPQVFNRFTQADASTTRSHGGLGLGLALVKQLVELHGGTVHAASPGLGRGSTFTVRFPLYVFELRKVS